MMKHPAIWLALCALTAFSATALAVAVPKAEPRAEEAFFNGKDLTGWEVENDVGVWSVKDGAIVATSGDEKMPNFQFLWNDTTVKNFHLSLMVKQTPYDANGGIQFRSARLDNGLAHGYQADVGKDWWGTLYHEHGRRVLGRRADAVGKNIKRESWNHYEILAVGQRVWLAINGKITVALRDKFGESEGRIALQAHSGIPQTVAYKELKLIHDPKVELAGMDEAALNALLVDAPKMGISPKDYLNPGASPADDGKKAPRKGRAVGIHALIGQLDLNADQKKNLAEFNQANHEKLATALKLKGDEKTAALRKINQARNAKLKGILTEVQATKLKKLQAQARANNKKQKEAEVPPTTAPPKPRPPARKNQGENTPKTTGKPSKQNKPNVILIMSDDMGYSDLPKFGKSEIPTPNIDRLAKEGTLFTDAYVTAPICVASRMGLLTGQYQQRFGIYDNIYGEDKTRLFLNQTLLPVVFQNVGYRTAHVGKWHLSGNKRLQYETAGPRERGFDESVAILGGGSAFWKGTPVFRNGNEFPAPEYLTDLWGTEACAFIDRAHAQPFFLYLAYNAVHSPMHALDGDRAKFPNVEDENRRTYDGMLLAMDRSIGLVLDRLDKHGIAENTIVVFLNDNGGGGSSNLYAAHSRNYANNKPLRGHKFDVLEGGVRVPMIIRWPKHAPAGKVYGEMVSSTDVYPTLVAAAGLQMPEGQPADGVDLLPFINGKNSSKPHEWLCWQNRSWLPRKKGGFVVPTSKVHNSAIRKGNWKLVRLNEKIGTEVPPPAWRLYDLSKDIGERVDLADKHREVVKELGAHFEKWRSSMHPTVE